jgi:hypothetical protein
MSLINWLKSARSLRSSTDPNSSYAMTQDNLVPDFHRSGSRPVLFAEEPDRTGRGRVATEPTNRPQATPGRWKAQLPGPRPMLKADSKGQLSLEFVKVVRNDLSDSDLELIPSRPSLAPKARTTQPATNSSGPEIEPLEPEPSRWNRFTSRLFGVGSTD